MVAFRSATLLLFTLFLLNACAPSSPRVEQADTFTPRPEKETLFVVPFTTVMVPAEVRETFFDSFVDILNQESDDMAYEFVILKNGRKGIDDEWLAQQHYLTGEVFGYVEDRGCCNTVIEINSRVRLHQPGIAEPTLQLSYPREIFFDHDYSTIEVERTRLAQDVAAALARRLLAALSGS